MVESIDAWSHTFENPMLTTLKQLHKIQEGFLLSLLFTLYKKSDLSQRHMIKLKSDSRAKARILLHATVTLNTRVVLGIIIKGTLLSIYCSFKCTL